MSSASSPRRSSRPKYKPQYYHARAGSSSLSIDSSILNSMSNDNSSDSNDSSAVNYKSDSTYSNDTTEDFIAEDTSTESTTSKDTSYLKDTMENFIAEDTSTESTRSKNTSSSSEDILWTISQEISNTSLQECGSRLELANNEVQAVPLTICVLAEHTRGSRVDWICSRVCTKGKCNMTCKNA